MADDLLSWRNRLAVPIVNWLLNHVATKSYRDRVHVIMRVGIGRIYGSAPELAHLRAESDRIEGLLPAPGGAADGTTS